MQSIADYISDFSLHCPFFPLKSLEHLNSYKYQAVDNSYLGKLFYQDYIVKPSLSLVPTWVAPNVITVTGGLFIILGLFTGYNFEILGSWGHLIIGILFYLYTLFDTLDGKQARRTGSGSPLGELMDHGVDVLVMGIFSLILCLEFNMTTFQTAYVYLVAFVIFYFPHWVQHQTGWMIFGPATNPIEMVHLYLFIEFLRAVMGWSPQVAHEGHFLYMVPNITFLLWFATAIMIDERNEGWSSALMEIVPFVCVSIVAFIVNVVEVDGFIIDQLRLIGSVFFVGMFVQWYIVTRLLGLPCPKLYINYYITLGIALGMFASWWFGLSIIVDIFAIVYFFHSLFWEAALVINVVYHFSSFLKIRPFKINVVEG
ncbi:Choline/ethanolaminephosphotransferase [Entamoeba marina]